MYPRFFYQQNFSRFASANVAVVWIRACSIYKNIHYKQFHVFDSLSQHTFGHSNIVGAKRWEGKEGMAPSYEKKK